MMKSAAPRHVPHDETLVRDSKTGRIVRVVGMGAMEDRHLAIREGVDLLKPIAEQVLKRTSGSRDAD